MHEINPALSIDVDEMFDPAKHPGVKRISAYDFEQMLHSNGSITVADNKFHGLVPEITTIESQEEPENRDPQPAPVVTDETKETISRLKEEIEKLTRTLQEFKLAPEHKTEQDDYSDVDIDEYDLTTARTANSGNIGSISLMKGSDDSNNLEIFETFTFSPQSSSVTTSASDITGEMRFIIIK